MDVKIYVFMHEYIYIRIYLCTPLVKCPVASFWFVNINHQLWSNGYIYIYICKRINGGHLSKVVPLVKSQIASFSFIHINHPLWSNGWL